MLVTGFNFVLVGYKHNAIITLCLPYVYPVKEKRLSLRMSQRRMDKIRQYAAEQEKTVTQIVSDWIDCLQLKDPKL